MFEFLEHGFMHRAFAAGGPTASACPALRVFRWPRRRSPLADTRWAAVRAAMQAWQAIRPYYVQGCAVTEKPDGPCTEADRLADRLIVQLLEEDSPTPRHAYLTEESEDRPERLESFCRSLDAAGVTARAAILPTICLVRGASALRFMDE